MAARVVLAVLKQLVRCDEPKLTVQSPRQMSVLARQCEGLPPTLHTRERGAHARCRTRMMSSDASCVLNEDRTRGWHSVALCVERGWRVEQPSHQRSHDRSGTLEPGRWRTQQEVRAGQGKIRNTSAAERSNAAEGRDGKARRARAGDQPRETARGPLLRTKTSASNSHINVEALPDNAITMLTPFACCQAVLFVGSNWCRSLQSYGLRACASSCSDEVLPLRTG